VPARHLEELSVEAISGYIRERIMADHIAPKTANRVREVLHRMFSYAIEHHGYVCPDHRYRNLVEGVRRAQESAPVITWLAKEQICEQLRIFQDSPTLQALVATLIYAGLRREEALWLTVDDVDLDKRLIYVRAKLVNEEHWQPKTKRNRVVPISSALHEILTPYAPPRSEPWFFPSPRGRRWDADNFSQDLREINRSHGLTWSCLDFRHTFGSHLAQKGESLYKIAELMGNSPEICRRHYAALVPEKMHDVVEFSPANSPTGDKTEVMLKQILEKLDQKEPASVGPKLRLIRTAGEEVAS
jgi:integrase